MASTSDKLSTAEAPWSIILLLSLGSRAVTDYEDPLRPDDRRTVSFEECSRYIVDGSGKATLQMLIRSVPIKFPMESPPIIQEPSDPQYKAPSRTQEATSIIQGIQRYTDQRRWFIGKWPTSIESEPHRFVHDTNSNAMQKAVSLSDTEVTRLADEILQTFKTAESLTWGPKSPLSPEPSIFDNMIISWNWCKDDGTLLHPVPRRSDASSQVTDDTPPAWTPTNKRSDTAEAEFSYVKNYPSNFAILTLTFDPNTTISNDRLKA